MRGDDVQQEAMFSYLSPEARVPRDHPLRPIRDMVNQALAELSEEFQAMYSREGRPSIPPEKLLRALLLQVLYTIRSARLLMEQLDYNLLFRWFVGLSPDDRVNLETCALAALGLRPTPHVCECVETHGGLCPLAPAIPWRPRAKCVWDDWRDIKQGGTVTLYILHLDGFPVLDAILAEMQAAEMTAEVNRWLAKS